MELSLLILHSLFAEKLACYLFWIEELALIFSEL